MTENRFDAEALDWDSKPFLHKSSRQALNAILAYPPFLQSNDAIEALEIGCGTGLLSLILAPHVRYLTAVDTSAGMIDMLKKKLDARPDITNVRAVSALLENPDDPRLQDSQPAASPKRFDLIVCHLTLHHIPNMVSFFELLFNMLSPHGHVVLTDYEDDGEQAKSFHPRSKWSDVERHGIKQEEVRDIMAQVGYSTIDVSEAFQLEKPIESGGTQRFPFLLMRGSRGC